MGLDKDSRPDQLVVCELNEDGTAHCTGDTYIIKNLTKFGAFSIPLERMAYPEDGQAFLDALPGNFTLGFLEAVAC